MFQKVCFLQFALTDIQDVNQDVKTYFSSAYIYYVGLRVVLECLENDLALV